MYKCEICNKEIRTLQSFVQHIIKIHNIQYEQYFDTYIEPNDNHICPICKLNKRKFFKGKYRKTCCDGLMEAKHQCMLQNNVIILTDCSKYIKYVEDTYGKTYLNKFIIHKKRKFKKVQIKK